jgi:hypothetical protein
MDVVLQCIPGCPNWGRAEGLLRQALQIVDATDATLTVEVIETAEQAVAARFTGSPTILIDGRDPFSDGGSGYGLACRVYWTPDGLKGTPTLEQIVTALGG